jgi:hypothetical protein
MPHLSPEEDFHAWALDAAKKAREGRLTRQELEQKEQSAGNKTTYKND